MAKLAPFQIEGKSKNYVRTLIEDTGCAVFREITGKDMGIDALIEIWDNGSPTGKIALLQLKGTTLPIIPSVRTNMISHVISSNCAKYALQKNVPVLIIYMNVNNRNDFYYSDIQSAVEKYDYEQINKQKTITVKISEDRKISNGWESFFGLINAFYS